jgi:hypothetical protein
VLQAFTVLHAFCFASLCASLRSLDGRMRPSLRGLCLIVVFMESL